jgi:hypothetical protein
VSDQAELTAGERRRDTWRVWFVAIAAIVLLNAIDLITTYVAIDMGADEGNPIVAWMISNRLVIAVKAVVCGGIVASAVVAWRQGRRVTLAELSLAWFAVGVYTLVVVLNSITVISLR